MIKNDFELLCRGTEEIIPIEEFKRKLENGKAHPRNIKIKLAKELCSQFYDTQTVDDAEAEFHKIFVNKDLPDEIPEFTVSRTELKDNKIRIVKLLVLTGIASTNGEARRLITGRGIAFENEKISVPDYELPKTDGILKTGKRKFMKILFS